MECLVKLQKRPKFIDLIEKFQLSGAYPVFFAILCTVSGLGDKYVYLPIISVLALSLFFSVLFVRDNKVFIAPIFMIYYSLGTDNSKAFVDSNGNVLAAFDTDGFIGICILAAFIFIPFLIRFIKDGSITLAFRERGIAFWGIAILNVAVLLGGLFSPYWSPLDLLYGAILIAGLDLFYIILYSIVKRSDASIIPYICRVLVVTCLLVSVQACSLALREHIQGNFVHFDEWSGRWILQRERLCLSWGVPTIICATSVCGIPAALYLAKNERFPILYSLSAIIMFAITILINTRSAMIAGGLFLLIGLIIISFSGKNKRCNLIFTSALLIASAVALVTVYKKMSLQMDLEEMLFRISKYLRFDSVNDRITIFNTGWQDFVSYPILGVGWNKGALSSDVRINNFYSNMYHCIVIQMGASAGTVGLLALIYHVKDMIVLAFKRARLDRIFLLSVPAMILLMSLVDNFVFYLNLQIFYVAFLAIAENHLNFSNKQ